MDWLDLLAVQGTFKSLLQHHSSNASILRHSTFFTVQLSHPYMTTGRTIALTRQTLVGKAMSLLLNMLSRLVITFLPRSKHLLISWLSRYANRNCQKWNAKSLKKKNQRNNNQGMWENFKRCKICIIKNMRRTKMTRRSSRNIWNTNNWIF